MSRILYTICLIFYLTFSCSAWASDAQIDWDKLLAGNVIGEAVENKDGLPGVRASFCVKAEREHIWSVLIDYDKFPAIFRNLKKIRVLERSQAGAKVEFWYAVKFLKVFNKDLHYVLDRRYIIPGRQITWTRDSGDLKRIEGSWEIRDTQKSDVYLLVYSSYVEPDWYVPVKLVRSGALNEATDMAGRIRDWIEQQP